MSRDRNDHLPQALVTPAVPAFTVDGGSVTATIKTGGVPLMTVPIPREEATTEEP